MSINPEATTGRTTPTEQRDYCVLCNTAPCEHPLPDWVREQFSTALSDAERFQRYFFYALVAVVFFALLALVGWVQ